jgi:NAD(P)-dependent dehydrogenase (short-subunit alcohol dehydrogenase family)
MTQKTWLVTGSSRGLGRDIVEAALEAGHNVVATARKVEALDDLVQKHDGALKVVRQDVTVIEEAGAAVDAAVETFGRLDVVVSNAGYADLGSVEDTSVESFRDQVETVFMGTYYTVKAALPVLREQGSGHLIQVSSVGARLATPGLAAYQAAKWAVSGFSEVLALEVAGLGIKVTSVEPGGMVTDWAGSSMGLPAVSPPYESTVGFMAQAIRDGAKPLGDPAKVAKVLFELSEMAEPPTRLILGSEAYAYATQFAAAAKERDEKFLELSRSTDRDDATPEERNPLGT